MALNKMLQGVLDLGRDYIIDAYNEIKNSISVQITLKNCVTIDRIEKVKEAYIGYLTGDDYLKFSVIVIIIISEDIYSARVSEIIKAQKIAISLSRLHEYCLCMRKIPNIKERRDLWKGT